MQVMWSVPSQPMKMSSAVSCVRGCPRKLVMGSGAGLWGMGGVQTQAVVALQHAQREGLQGRRLVAHDAPVAGHLSQTTDISISR